MNKAVLVFVFFFPLTGFGTADGPDYWDVRAVASDDVLNIRSEANWKSEKVGQIPYDGKCVQNLGCVGGLTMQEFTDLSEYEKNRIRKERPRWCKVNYKSIEGWVSGRYLGEAGGECP